MNILTLCSALNCSYFGFLYNDKLITKIIKSDDKNYHSLYLIPKIKEVANTENIDLSKLDLISVNTGTGSFTGIRVAMSIAKVIAGELNLPLIPLTTSEILLKAYRADYLITDARRDMYFIGMVEGTELIYKDKINDIDFKNKKLLTDKRCKEIFKDSTCYEDNELDLAKTMIELTKEKYENEKDREKFNPLSIEANYIQTPPVF